MRTWSKLDKIIHTWSQLAKQLKTETYALYLVYQDPRTPWYARIMAVLIVAYAFSPIDLIPDFIPILGYLDDLILLPLGIALTLRLIPACVLAKCRTKAQTTLSEEIPTPWTTAALIIAIWLGVIGIGAILIFQ